MHYKDVVCNCLGVTVEDIKEAIDDGATTLEEVQKATKAGTGCGSCRNNLKELIEDLQK
ncbi:MAG: (2Fe-2S)-binding protein [Peptostreptococcaceae bacterium]